MIVTHCFSMSDDSSWLIRRPHDCLAAVARSAAAVAAAAASLLPFAPVVLQPLVPVYQRSNEDSSAPVAVPRSIVYRYAPSLPWYRPYRPLPLPTQQVY